MSASRGALLLLLLLLLLLTLLLPLTPWLVRCAALWRSPACGVMVDAQPMHTPNSTAAATASAWRACAPSPGFTAVCMCDVALSQLLLLLAAAGAGAHVCGRARVEWLPTHSHTAAVGARALAVDS
jgi:hypothetical protein